MSVIDLLSDLDKEKLKDSELTIMFDALEDYINGPEIVSDDVRPHSISYRHLAENPRRVFGLFEFSPTVRATSYGGWYIIDNATFSVVSNLTDGVNYDGESAPNLMMESLIFLADGINTMPATSFTIGFSTDAGATFTAVTGGSRPVGWGSGYAPKFFDVPQPSYWGGLSSPIPSNEPSDGFIKLSYAFGGPGSLHDPATINRYGVMINANTFGNAKVKMYNFLRTRDR